MPIFPDRLSNIIGIVTGFAMPVNTFLARFCAFLRVLRDNRAFSVSTRTPLVAFYENKVHFKHAHKSYLHGEHFLQQIAYNNITQHLTS